MPEYKPPVSHYCHVTAYPEKKDMFKLIGPQGHNFKRLTTKLKIEYLWWDIEKNVIEIWGGYDRVMFANEYMQKYMVRFYENHIIKNTLQEME